MPEDRRYEFATLSGKKEFRLLEILDRHPSLIGRLRHVSLGALDSIDRSSEDHYTAISYCWGDPTPVDRVWLGAGSYIPINRSAAYVLRNASCAGSLVWLDSVCINQHDNEEKSLQVRMMPSIYRYASNTLVCLGETGDHVELALDLVLDIVYAQKRFKSGIRLNDGTPTRYVPEVWQALWRLLDRPWFKRGWVIQEATVGRDITVFCAGRTVKWSDLSTLIEKLTAGNCFGRLMPNVPAGLDTLLKLPSGVNSINRIDSLRKADGQHRYASHWRGSISLQDVLVLTADSETSDPRDKIFSLVSLQPDLLFESLLSYQLSAAEVFTITTRHILRLDQQLTVLVLAGIGWSRTLPDLPSWVPDYSRAPNISPSNPDTRGRRLSACRDPQEAQWGYQRREYGIIKDVPDRAYGISINGCIVDRVVDVSAGLPAGRRICTLLSSKNREDHKLVLSWINRARRLVAHPRSISSGAFLRSVGHEASLYQDLYLALAGGRYLDFHSADEAFIAHRMSVEEHPVSEAMFEAFMTLLLATATSTEEYPLKMHDWGAYKQAAKYLELLESIPEWSTFRTKHGFVGRGPPLVAPGDRVCFLQGARAPYAIREATSTPFGTAKTWKLVGRCFVEGMVHGHVARQLHRDKWRPIIMV